MRSKTRLLAGVLLLLGTSAFANTLSEAIARQEALEAQKAKEALMASKTPLTSSRRDVPVLRSVLSIGERYVLRFQTDEGTYMVTNDSPYIGRRWKLLKVEGLSALVQRGKNKPERVFLSVADETAQAQLSVNATPLPPVPPVPAPVTVLPPSMPALP